MAMRPATVSDQLPFGEGPVWCPDGTLVCTSITFGALYRIDVDTGRTTQIADTAGGANSALLADDGSFVVCQNGGIDLSSRNIPGLPPVRFVRGGLQHVTADGEVRYLTPEPLQAPNDLVTGPDGTIWFTDPETHPPTGRNSRVLGFRRDGSIKTLLAGYYYTNGIALDADGETLVVVADDFSLVKVRPGEQPEVFVEHLGEGGGDGLCLDADGRYYVAARLAGGIQVFDPDGTPAEFLAAEDGAFITNCCFGGSDGRTLFATDAGRNSVLAWSGMATPGLPVHTWPGLL